MRLNSIPFFTLAVLAAGCGRSSGNLAGAGDNSPARVVEVSPHLETAISPIVNEEKVALTFGIDLSADVAKGLELKGFECRFAEDVAYRDCSAKPYEIASLEDGKIYALHVRAQLVNKETS